MSKAVVVTGPTASGKTSFAHRLFELLDCSQIISADSKQVFKDLNIGTAKPSFDDIKKYHYKLIDCLEPDEFFSVHDFFSKVTTHLKSSDKSLIVGGTAFYLDTLRKGSPVSPPISRKIKEAVLIDFKKKGLNYLLKELSLKDPVYFQTVDKHNHRRVCRAIEVIRASNKPFSKWREERVSPVLDCLLLVLLPPREKMNQEIDNRVDDMVHQGLFEEVKSVLKKGISPDSLSLSGIGYREIVNFLKQKDTQDQKIIMSVINNIKRNSRKYAKQQLTWLKGFKGCLFLFDNDNFKMNDRSKLDKRDEWFYNIPKADVNQIPSVLLDKLKNGESHRLSLEYSHFLYQCLEEFYES